MPAFVSDVVLDTLPLGLGFRISSAPVEIDGIEGGYVYGDYGGVSLVIVREGVLDDGVPIMVSRTSRAQRLKASPESVNARPNEVETTVFAGQPVRTMGRLYWADGSLVDRRDVLDVERWLFDVTGRVPIHLATDRFIPQRVLYSTLMRNELDWGVDPIGFQFDNEVDGQWFEGGRQYVIEWVLIRNTVSRERLPIVNRVDVKPLLSGSGSRFGRRSSS